MRQSRPCPNGWRRPVRAGVGVCLALMIGLVAACQSGDEAPASDKDDLVVAQVMEKPVWASDVRREALAQGLIHENEKLDIHSALFRQVLDEMMDQKLLAAEARRRGLDRSEAFQRRVDAVQERILGDMLVEGEVSGTVSEAAIQRLYQEQQRRAQTTEELRVRLILSQTEAQAEAVMAILAQGATFEAVAAQRSTDAASRYSGGDLGYSSLDLLPDPYAAALKGQQTGKVIGPVAAANGWAVLKIEDRRLETPPTLEQARPLIVRYLTYEGVRQLLEQLRGKAKVDVFLNPAPPSAAAVPEAPAAAPPVSALPDGAKNP